MRDEVILAAVVVVAASSVVTSFGVVWLCAKVTTVTDRFFLGATDHLTADAVVAATLARVEEAARDAKKAAAHTAERVDVATELAYQNAEAVQRMEVADADVAHDLADSIARADDLPKDGNYGAAADAALRSGPEDSP